MSLNGILGSLTATPESGQQPLTVQFTDTVARRIVENTDFQNNIIESTTENTDNTYIREGIYG